MTRARSQIYIHTFLKSEPNIISLYHQTQDSGSGWRIFLSLAGVNDQGYSLDMVMFWYWSLSNTSTWILNPRNHHRHWLKENLCTWQGELEGGKTGIIQYITGEKGSDVSTVFAVFPCLYWIGMYVIKGWINAYKKVPEPVSAISGFSLLLILLGT